MSVSTFNEKDLVVSGGKDYIYIRRAGEYHFVQGVESGQKVYKTEVELKNPPEPSKAKIEYIDVNSIPDIDVFQEGKITAQNEEVLKGLDFSNIINRVNHCKWEDGIKLIPDNSIDEIVTDPPYGMSWKSNRRKDKSKRHDKIANDDNIDWLPSLVAEHFRVLKEGAHIYIFCSNHFLEYFKIEYSKLFNFKHILIWDKKQGNLGDLKGNYSTFTENILFLTKGKGKDLNGGRDSNILRHVRTKNLLHPTEKPVDLIAYLIRKSSNPEDLILDTFAGSHSTAKACKETGRNFITFEMEEKYCKDAERDIPNYHKTLF